MEPMGRPLNRTPAFSDSLCQEAAAAEEVIRALAAHSLHVPCAIAAATATTSGVVAVTAALVSHMLA